MNGKRYKWYSSHSLTGYHVRRYHYFLQNFKSRPRGLFSDRSGDPLGSSPIMVHPHQCTVFSTFEGTFHFSGARGTHARARVEAGRPNRPTAPGTTPNTTNMPSRNKPPGEYRVQHHLRRMAPRPLSAPPYASLFFVPRSEKTSGGVITME